MQQSTENMPEAHSVPEPLGSRMAVGRGGGLRKALLAVGKLSISIGAIVLLLRLVDLRVFMERTRSIDNTTLVLVVLVLVAQVLLASFRWRLIVRLLGGNRSASGTTYIRLFYLAQMLGQLAPFVAGDVLRAFLLARAGVTLRISAKSVLLDRAIALIFLFIIALPAAVLSPLLQSTGYHRPIVAMIGLGLGATAVMLALAGPLGRTCARWRVVSLLAETSLDLRRLFLREWESLYLAGFFVAVHGCTIVAFWLLARGEGLQLDFLNAAAIVPLALMAAFVPVAVGGWGVREGLVVGLLTSAGVSMESALLLSLSFGAALLVAAIPGAVIWFLPDHVSRMAPGRIVSESDATR